MNSRFADRQEDKAVLFVEPRSAEALRMSIMQRRLFNANGLKRLLEPEFNVVLYNPYTIDGTRWSSRMSIRDLSGNHIEMHTPHECDIHRPSDSIKVYLIGGTDTKGAEVLINRISAMIQKNNIRRLVRSECQKR